MVLTNYETTTKLILNKYKLNQNFVIDRRLNLKKHTKPSTG